MKRWRRKWSERGKTSFSPTLLLFGEQKNRRGVNMNNNSRNFYGAVKTPSQASRMYLYKEILVIIINIIMCNFVNLYSSNSKTSSTFYRVVRYISCWLIGVHWKRKPGWNSINDRNEKTGFLLKIECCVVAKWLACWFDNHEVRGSNPGQGRNLVRDFCSTCAPSQLSYDDYTVSGKMRWWGKERTGHPPSYAVAKKMKSLTLHTHGCPRASLRDRSSSKICFCKSCGRVHMRKKLPKHLQSLGELIIAKKLCTRLKNYCTTSG